MTTQFDHHAPSRKRTIRIYSPDLLAQAQDLLSELADLACALEKDLETLRKGSLPEPVKLARIDQLQARYQEQHALIADELSALEKRIAQDLRL